MIQMSKGVVEALTHWHKVKPEGSTAVSKVKMLGKSAQEERRDVYTGRSQVGAWYIPMSQRKESRKMRTARSDR